MGLAWEHRGGESYATDDEGVGFCISGNLEMTGAVGDAALLGVLPGNAGQCDGLIGGVGDDGTADGGMGDAIGGTDLCMEPGQGGACADDDKQ